MMLSSLRKKLLAVTGLAVAIGSSAYAQVDLEKTERCASRLSIALLGKAPTTAMMALPDPQVNVDQMLAGADFIERFSRYVNATFNDDPGVNSAEDAPYHLARYVLQNNRPWEEMFLGQYGLNVIRTGTTVTAVNVVSDPNGLGYFRARDWVIRYAGNEENNVKISHAYRIMHNTVGLRLIASTNAPGADITATGRQAAGCRACHYDSWFGLDKTAEVLGLVPRTPAPASAVNYPAGATVVPVYTGGPKSILGGLPTLPVASDKELVTQLVKSEAFKFNSCRMAFQFLHGRAEQTCEGPIFDQCMLEFSAKGTITSALAVVAKSQSYCQ